MSGEIVWVNRLIRANISQAFPSPSAVSGSCLPSERDAWKALRLGRQLIVCETSFDPARGKQHFIQPLASHAHSTQHLWDTQAPIQMRAPVSNSSYLHAAYDELWIGRLHESKLRWVHASFPWSLLSTIPQNVIRHCSQTFSSRCNSRLSVICLCILGSPSLSEQLEIQLCLVCRTTGCLYFSVIVKKCTCLQFVWLE